MNSIELLFDGLHGIYIPQRWAQECAGVQGWQIPYEMRECVEILRTGPNHDLYWEAWVDILDHVTFQRDGRTWHLHQDDDVFAIDYDNLTREERRSLFGTED